MPDAGEAQLRFAEAVARCEADPRQVESVRALAPPPAEPPNELDVRWAMLTLAADLDREAGAGAAGPDPGVNRDDSWRERYGALVDAGRAFPHLDERIRALGKRLRELEDDGVLPQTMVARSPRKPAP